MLYINDPNLLGRDGEYRSGDTNEGEPLRVIVDQGVVFEQKAMTEADARIVRDGGLVRIERSTALGETFLILSSRLDVDLKYPGVSGYISRPRNQALNLICSASGVDRNGSYDVCFLKAKPGDVFCVTYGDRQKLAPYPECMYYYVKPDGVYICVQPYCHPCRSDYLLISRIACAIGGGWEKIVCRPSDSEDDGGAI